MDRIGHRSDVSDLDVAMDLDADDNAVAQLHDGSISVRRHVTDNISRQLDGANSNPRSRFRISTTFYRGSVISREIGRLDVDLVIVSQDRVHFYVEKSSLLSASNNGFNNSLSLSPNDNRSYLDTLYLPDHSNIINILLHAIYSISCRHYAPTLDELMYSVSAMQVYGMPLTTYLASSSPTFDLLLSHGLISPLEVYTLAAAHGLEDLAVATSVYLLSLPLHLLTDEHVSNIGPIYTRRLFALHFNRTEAFKNLLAQPPQMHTPIPTCSPEEQRNLVRVWELLAAYLTLEARPDMDDRAIEAAFRSSQSRLNCSSCKATLLARSRLLILQWSAVKRTI